MSDRLLIEIITTLRVGVATSWAIITAIGFCAFVRLIAQCARPGDLRWASSMMIGIGLLIFQWRALADYTPSVPDPFAAIALFSFFVSGIVTLYVRYSNAPEGHERAAVLSHAGMIVMLLGAGLLSS
jgi:hypothetical protein